jgi:hypothetical protein
MPHTRFKLGKHAPKFHAKTLFFHKYFVAVPPAPKVSYYDLRLRQSDWGMLGNDAVGDCAIAAPCHQIILSNSYTRATKNPTLNDTFRMYSDVSGYDPSQTDTNGNNSTDVGCAMTDVWDYLMKKGVILGWVSVNWNNLEHVRAAINIFGGLQRGVQLPQSAMDQYNSNQNWDVVADDGGILGGHAIFDTGYHPNPLFPTVTWGRALMKTLPWDLKYTDELYALIFKSWLTVKSQMSPSHLNFTALQNDLQAIQQ